MAVSDFDSQLGDWNVVAGISSSQVEAALALRRGFLPGWHAASEALYEVGRELGTRSRVEVLGRVAAVDAVYNAQVGRILGMSDWLYRLHAEARLQAPFTDPASVVELIGSIDGKSDEGCQVFASKYAHFCLDPTAFAVFDKYAARALLCHWGKDEAILEGRHRYRKFMYILNGVLAVSDAASSSFADLDAYLWLAGVFREWTRAGRDQRTARISKECRLLFEAHSTEDDEVGRLLHKMVPNDAFFDTLRTA